VKEINMDEGDNEKNVDEGNVCGWKRRMWMKDLNVGKEDNCEEIYECKQRI